MRKISPLLLSALILLSFIAIPLSVSAYVCVSPSQMSAYRLDAKGGIPGPNPKPQPEPTPPAIEYELFVEIDYMEGHRPTDSVLIYVHEYYYARGINVTFYLDDVNEYSDVVADPTPYTGVTDEDFRVIENTYNDNDEGYYSNWKWVLFGTTVDGENDTIGYTLVMLAQIRPKKADVLAGNYIFIADESADSWAIGEGTSPYGVEAVVLMHELGHSIGIGIVEWNVFYGWVEVYDRDTYSVMSYLNINNAGSLNQWYYSDKYWSTRNMNYYLI